MQRLPTAQQINHITRSWSNVDLNSASKTRSVKFLFPSPPAQSTALISILYTREPAAVCLQIKDWFVRSFAFGPEFCQPEILRMEPQGLQDVDLKKKGWVLIAEDACVMDYSGVSGLSMKEGKTAKVTVIGVLVDGDSKVRWFYTMLHIGSMLKRLNTLDLLMPEGKALEPGKELYRRFSTYIRESFLAAVTIPESPDYLNAMQITDCCPPILNPDRAMQRLEKNEYIHFSHKNTLRDHLDISDDRYLLYLHEAEREVASAVHLKCAEYLLVKRNFFKAFFEDIYRSDKAHNAAGTFNNNRSGNANGASTRGIARPVAAPSFLPTAETTPASTRHQTPAPPSTAQTPTPTPAANVRDSARSVRTATTQQSTQASASARDSESPSKPTNTPRRGGARTGWRKRVRTENSHKAWLENTYDFGSSRSKLLVKAWNELGFLDEDRYFDWVKAGGMFEEIGRQDGSEDEEMEDECNGVHDEE